MEELIFKIEEKPSCCCPYCGGWGTNQDGYLSIGPTEIRSRPASKCYFCKGKGRVNITPLED